MSLLRSPHALLICDKQLANRAITVIQEADPAIYVHSCMPVKTKRVRDSTIACCLRRGKEEVDLGIVVGDPDSEEGPYDGKCWIFIDAKFSIWKSSDRLASDVKRTLIAVGATEG